MSKKTSKFLSKGKKKSADFDFALDNFGKKNKNISHFTNQSDNFSNPDSESIITESEKMGNLEEGNLETNLNLSKKIDFIKTQKTQFEEKNEKENWQLSPNFEPNFETNLEISGIKSEAKIEESYISLESHKKEVKNKPEIKSNNEIKKFDIFDFLKPKEKYQEIPKNSLSLSSISQKPHNKFSEKTKENKEYPGNIEYNNLEERETYSSKGTSLEIFNFGKDEPQKNENYNSNLILQSNAILRKNLKNNLIVHAKGEGRQVNEKITKPKTFKENIGDGELRLLLTTHSIQEEIDQHLSPKDEYENVLLTNKSEEKNEFELENVENKREMQKNLERKVENKDEFAEFEHQNKQNINQFGNKHNIDKNINHSKTPLNQTFEKNSKLNFEAQSLKQKFPKRNIENSEDKAKFVIARQNYQKEQKKSQFNLILRIIAVGCLFAVLLFYFQGLQPLILSQITQKNQEKIIKLSQTFQNQVGNYFEITQELNTKVKSDSDQKCTQNYTDSQMKKDSKKIEDLINNNLKVDQNITNSEKYWNFNSDQIEKEYLQVVDRYQQSLAIYRQKSDYLVDYLYFLLQRNSWQEVCQNIKNTNSLKQFEEICKDWKTLNEKYKRARKSEFFGNIDIIITSFDINCGELNNTESPNKWRENWLEKYTILMKTLPNNDNSKLYQMNEQTLVEFQTRSRNIWTIYEQKTNGIGNLYLLNLER